MVPPQRGKFGKQPDPPELYYQPTRDQLNEDQANETEAPEGSQTREQDVPETIVEAVEKKVEKKNGAAAKAEAVPFPEEGEVGAGNRKSSFSARRGGRW